MNVAHIHAAVGQLVAGGRCVVDDHLQPLDPFTIWALPDRFAGNTLLSHPVVETPCIYRAPMRARDLDIPAGAGAEYGLAFGVVGIGSGHGEKAARALHRFSKAPSGVFVWTRDRAGDYHLGRVAGPVREERSPAARAVGIAYVRDTRWLARAFKQTEVPAAVAQTFARGGRNFQRTHDREAERMTSEIWLHARTRPTK